MTNIRGEITTLIAIDELIGIREHERSPSQKFIIFMPEAARGNNIGMIVDEVYSVLEVDESDIEYTGNGGGTAKRSFVKGIIRIHTASDDGAGAEVSQRLVLYLDIDNLIAYLFEMASR
jgi:purine-binding chemotaxis protein CheW